MKVIDLLNKIANKEEVPEKIEVFGYTFFRYEDEWSNFYYYATADKEEELMTQLNSTNQLNDEVEIIEEPKEIEKLENFEITDTTISGLVKSLNVLHEDYVNKINTVIDYLNQKENK